MLNVLETRERSRTSQKVGLFIAISSFKGVHYIGVGVADVISTVEFDSTGNYLATGDKGGRVVLFERNEQVRPPPFLRPPAFSPADWISSLNPLPFFLSF